MFAVRDQENAVYMRQNTAAAKPLNQGLQPSHSRTPGITKTPFGAARHDENQHFTLKKQMTTAKDRASKADPVAFATPAALKLRAPLGVKTTNAKAQPLKTLGLNHTSNFEKSSKRPSSTRRSARKLTIAAEAVQSNIIHNDINEEEEEPEFGYAPPPIVELPDPPMDLEHDYSLVQPYLEDIDRGYGEIYFGSPKDEHGISIRLKKEEDEARRFQEQEERRLTESILRQQSTRADPDAEVDAMIAAGPRAQLTAQPVETNVSTVTARMAAAALSQTYRRVPAAASKHTISSLQKANHKPPLAKGSSVRDSAPLSVSKNTIGFPKARKAPSIIPQHKQQASKQIIAEPPVINQGDIHPARFVELYGEPPMDSEMWFRLKQYELLEKETTDLFDGDIDPAYGGEADSDLFMPGFDLPHDDFQLPMPED